MTTVGGRNDGFDDGHLAVLGHTLVGSTAVVAAALRTLRDDDGSIPAEERGRLEQAAERNLDSIAAIARTLIHGVVARESQPAFCAQCYGRETVRIDGRTIPCTCVSWPRVVSFRGARDGFGQRRK